MIRLGIRNLPKLDLQHAITSQVQPRVVKTLNILAKPTSVECTRTVTFFNKVTAEAIWKSENTVSNAGKKRGRGRSTKKHVDLNKGQLLGVGKINLILPGLNAPIMQGQDVVQFEKLPKDEKFDEKRMSARSTIMKKFRQSSHPLERGWSGRRNMGKSLGPPESIEYKEGFDSYVCERKLLKLTHAKFGRLRSMAAFVVVGNGNGLIGISSATSEEMKGAIKKAQKQASRKLNKINLEEGYTVNHDFFYQYGRVKLFVYRKPRGYGLVCNRGIEVCCKVLGITDLYAKVEGSKNKQHVIKAFILGLLDQKTYQQMADENKLHLVEQREETYMFPKVLASPSEVLQKKNHALLYSEYVMNGKLPFRGERKHVIEFLPNYETHLKKTYYARNHDQVKLRLRAEFGKYQSHLSDIYPECQEPLSLKKKGAAKTSEQ